MRTTSIKEIRSQRGITQKELADKIGVNQSAVHLWESRKNNPRISTLFKIADALDCDVRELLIDEKRGEQQ